MDATAHATSDEGMRARLALALLVLIMLVVVVLLFHPTPQANRDLLTVSLGVLLASLKDVYGYSFGGSAGRDKQADTLNKVADTAQKAASAASAATGTVPDAIPVAPGESVTVTGETP